MRTLCAMALAANEMADRIQVKSPVDPGAFASPWRMCDCNEVILGRSLARRRMTGSGIGETVSFRHDETKPSARRAPNPGPCGHPDDNIVGSSAAADGSSGRRACAGGPI